MKIKKILWGILIGIILCTGCAGTVTASQNNRVSSVAEKNDQSKKKYMVVLHYSNGKVYKKYTVSNGKIKLPSMPNKRGITFMGWSTKKGTATNPEYETGDTIQVKKNRNLYAVEFRRSAEADISKNNIPNPQKYSRIIYVGDSRTYAMGRVVREQFGNRNFKNIYFVAKTGTTLDWLKNTGEHELMKILEENTDGNKKTAIIFNHGVNDLNHNWSNVNVKNLVSDYSSYMKKLGRMLQKKNCDLYFMSVNPLNSGVKSCTGRHDPREIRQFNKELGGRLAGMYQYIDTYSYLKKTGYGTARWLDRQNEDDGLHYTYKTYKRIFYYCMRKLSQ